MAMNRTVTIRNPFKRHGMKKAFDACVGTFEAGGFLNPDGTQNRGGSHKISFWNGFNGVADHYTQPGTLGWAAYRAGQACRKEYPDINPPTQERHKRQS